MKSHLFLIPAIFATTAALADSQTAVSPKPADAHTQAAALLSRPNTSVTVKRERSSVSETDIDAHASAAALLSGHRIARQATVSSAVREPSYGQTSADAHSQAAALLSGTRTLRPGGDRMTDLPFSSKLGDSAGERTIMLQLGGTRSNQGARSD